MKNIGRIPYRTSHIDYMIDVTICYSNQYFGESSP